ncbi:WD40 repeat domain-containing protein [Streptomyces sp. HNM0575]|uniref:WD40 repeat domain-containing protein n=1 Tax=Streptomyces sp. HNM0575 TaxID=2716338 RepID=UPI00145FAD47|nr:WD40 repeat domain-containing protein [Streptomyces sp. HNM0575]NLU75659.1 WD40 repeat domain-containing protein [Streptomyces sp. HNM0575]
MIGSEYGEQSEGAHPSPDGRYQVRVNKSNIFIETSDGKRFDWFDSGSDWGPRAMDFSPDGRFFAVAVPDSVIIYNFHTKNPRALISKQLINIRFSDDGNYIVGEEFLEHRSGRFVTFNVHTGKRTTSPTPPTVEDRSDPKIWQSDELAIVNKGRRVIAAGVDGYFVWSVSDRHLTWMPCGCQPTGAAVDRKAHRVAYMLPEGRISLWRTSDRREISRWKLPKAVDHGREQIYAGAAMAFAEGRDYLLTYFLDKGEVWALPKGEFVGSWKGSTK